MQTAVPWKTKAAEVSCRDETDYNNSVLKDEGNVGGEYQWTKLIKKNDSVLKDEGKKIALLWPDKQKKKGDNSENYEGSKDDKL